MADFDRRMMTEAEAGARLPMVRLRGVAKRYDGQKTAAVSDLDLDIEEGEIFALLGPSGCGKTTTLRMVAGLEDPDEGSIWFKDRPIVVASRRFFVPPEKRQVGMVFQSYAIWPHMTVEENIAYPLRVRRQSEAEIRERVGRVLELVGMSTFAKRSAMQLSGGQQQRVALARALVYEPGLLLLDEPFSNLDTKLRDQMRYEVKMLQQKLKITVLFVTHDQVEALSLSNRLAVLNHGTVQQVGRPRDLYEQPANEFVRDFLGKAVVLRGVVSDVTSSNVNVRLDGAVNDIALDAEACAAGLLKGDRVCLSARPEDIEIRAPGQARNGEFVLEGRVESALFVGERTEYRVMARDQESFSVYSHRRSNFSEGDLVQLAVATGGSGLWFVRHADRAAVGQRA